MIYVMSDIHGNRRRFDSIMEQIGLQPEDHLYVLGDVIDRHPHGIDILLQLMDMPNVTMLLGNHEHMMLNSYDPLDKLDRYWRQEFINLWLQNGGYETIEAFGKLDESSRSRVLSYLQSLPVKKTIVAGHKRYYLVHATPIEMYDPTQLNQFKTDTEYAVWNRLHHDTKLPRGSIVVFGHTPTDYYVEEVEAEEYYKLGIWVTPKRKPGLMSIWRGDHRICIDCGSGYPDEFDKSWGAMGRLACLRLDDGKEFYSLEHFEQD